MSIDSPEARIVWTRRGSVKREPVVVARRLNSDWFANEIQTAQVRFIGELGQSLTDLLTIAKRDKRLNLPIIRLRAALMAGLDGVIAIDRDLGVLPRPGYPAPSALEMYPSIDGSDSIRKAILAHLKRWAMEVLEPWAAKHQLDTLVLRVKKAAVLESVELTPAERPLAKMAAGVRRLDFAMAIREIGERLAGETLFTAERGSCDLVVNAESSRNSIELMTPPRKGMSGEEVFSMVARISIVTVPYSTECFLRVGATKRVWARRVPGIKQNAPRRVTGYVLSPGRPVLPISIVRTQHGWEFGEDYLPVLFQSEGALPAKLEQAVQRLQAEDDGWWVGLPELPTLFDSVAPRTVFEADEIDLLAAITERLSGITGGPVSFVPHKLPRGQAKSSIAMLKLSDIGMAGAGLAVNDDDELEDDAAEVSEADQSERLAEHRDQNTRALHLVHREERPTLWAFGGTPEEQDLIKKSVEALFGNAVLLKPEVLPNNAHGLRDNLPEKDASAAARFDARVDAWRESAGEIAKQPGPRFALVCASDREGRRAEDVVNYYAGIYALCSIGNANVHHVLPISGADSERAKQNFVHRLQSALLDVFLAHSGIVFGVKEFLGQCYRGNSPKAVYGIQAVRSRARAFSGESDVTFVVVTRLVTDSGVTEVQFCYRGGTKDQRSNWMPLAEGLRWLGSQRSLTTANEQWLKRSFKGLVKDSLASIAVSDPRALVLIDWDNVAGLWQGIRDDDLIPGTPPKLDGLNLATAFPEMSLVRVRRSNDSMSVRGMARATFDGWREAATRESTGEHLPDEYPTTTKSLVEIVAPMLPEPRRFGHFIASMGYSKTAQVKRGFSCYRSMPRMVVIKGTVVTSGEKARLFERKTLEPANMDASVPAPLEITVMTTPPDVGPSDVATAVMGLRLGYAHYNDWTALPAPLFFKRKIEDYVIRYRDAAPAEELTEPADGSPDVGPEVPDDAVEDHDATNEYAQAVAGTVMPPPAAMPEAADSLDSNAAEALVANADRIATDPLSRAKQLEVPVLYSSTDPKVKRLYQAMLQDEGARVKIRVEIPAFVTTRALFGAPHLTTRDYRRLWRQTREFGYVRQTAPQPSNERFLDWMTQRLNRPQAAYSLEAVIGPLMFKPIDGLVARYNQAATEPLRNDSLARADFKELAAWAVKNRDDAAVAWLLFYAAQMPGYGCAHGVLEGTSALPGALSQEALGYFIDSAEACAEAVEHKSQVGQGFPSIQRNRPLLGVPRPDQESSHLVNVAIESAPKASPSSEPIQPFASVSGDPVMTIKNEIIACLDQLRPGQAQFENLLLRIQEQLSALEAIHSTRLNEQSAASDTLAAVTRYEESANRVLSAIHELRPDLALDPIAVRVLPTDGIERGLADIDAVSTALTVVASRRKAELQLASVPLKAGATLAERRQRNAQEGEVVEALAMAMGELEAAIRKCSAFELSCSSPPESPITKTPPNEPNAGAPISSGTEPVATAFGANSAQRSATTSNQAETADVSLVSPEVSVATLGAPEMDDTEIARVEIAAPEDIAYNADEGGADAETTLLDAIAVTTAFASLEMLVGQRRYALAALHGEAMGELLPAMQFRPHRTIFGALFSALNSLDCNFAVDSRLDPALKGLLKDSPPSNGEYCDQLPLSVGVLGASIVAMLFDGSSSDSRWTVLGYLQTRFLGHNGLVELVERIGTLDNHGISLTRDNFSASHVGALKAVEAELARMQERAKNWNRDPEINSMWNHRGYKNIHDEMFNPQNPIGRCLVLIDKGDFSRLKSAYEEAQKKFAKAPATLDELARAVKERGRPDGKPRAWLIENLATTDTYIRTCLDLAEKCHTSNFEIAGNVQTFLDGLYGELKRAIDDIRSITPTRPVESIYRQSTITVLESVLRLYDETVPAACVPDDQQMLLIQLPMERNFQPSVVHHDCQQCEGLTSVCDPDEVLAETRRLSGEALLLDSYDEESGLEPALRDAARSHAASSRFIPAFAIDARYPKTFGGGENGLLALHQKARAALDSELHDARQQVAHAMALSALDSADANRMLRVIEDIRSANSAKFSIGHPQGESLAFPDFPHARAVLRRNVRELLDRRLTDIRVKLAHQVDAYESEHGHEARRDIARIRDMLATNNASNLRTAHDAYAMLKKDGRLPPAVLGTRNVCESYEHFVGELKLLLGTHKPLLDLVLDMLSQAPTAGEPEWLASLDVEARQEASRFVSRWAEACKTKTLSTAGDTLPAFFKACGITTPPSCMNESARVANRIKFILPEKTFAAEGGDTFVPPSLGSRATNIQGFVLTGRPQDTEIRAAIQEAGATPTLILGRMHLTLEKRAKLSRNAQVILLDDDLVAYMAVHAGERTRRLLEVGLLTYYTNPYGDYGGIPVPPEMFFGRQTELVRLRRVQSAAILYGGRRLGKSSLLDQIEREGRVLPGSTTAYIQMDGVKFAQDHVLYAWTAVYRALAFRGIVPTMQQEPSDWRAIQSWFEKELTSAQGKTKSCYLLLDEADALMGRELGSPASAPSFIRSLQQTCEAVQRHCHVRYVVAGLHNVTRMSTEENSPLGKAEPIALEPFSSADDIQRGIELVTKPLAALGFFFAKGDEDLPLRILSVCNFYPAFIQLYCHNLLERLYNIRQDQKPPTYISSKDLDAVERDSNLLTELQRKFELNLNLDKRYKAIALILADVYYTESESGQYNGLTTAQIQDYCETYAAPHFQKTGPGAYEALVDEMRKLNVLERVGSRYVLRNPNIAMMMGDRERISYLIDELARETPEQARGHGERRIAIVRNKMERWFPMPAAWVRTNVEINDGELIVLVGNNVSGLAEIANVQDEWQLGPECTYSLKAMNNPQTASAYLRKLRSLPKGQAPKRLLAVTSHSWKVSEISQYAAVAAKSQQMGRLALLALPDKAWELARAISAGQFNAVPPEKGPRWRIVPVPQWTEDSVYFFLDENIAVAESAAACQALLTASCGFGSELVRICSGQLTVDAARASVAAAEKAFAPNLENFYSRIGMPESIGPESLQAIQTFFGLVDDGIGRNSAEIDEAMQLSGMTPALLLFASWMGLLQEGPANTWKVPHLYRRLLS